MINGIRQVAIMVESLEDATGLYTRTLGTKICHSEDLTRYALRNAVMPTGEGTFVELLQPTDPQSAGGRFLQRKGEAYKRIVELAPKEIMKLLAQQNLSVEEATRLSVALISLEAEANPEKVSFPVRVITLPKNGGGNLAVYDRVF